MEKTFEIPLFHADRIYDCLEDCIIALAKWYHTDFELMAMDVLWFSFNAPPTSPTIGKGIEYCTEAQTLKNLSTFHGLDLTCHQGTSQELYQLTRQELQAGHPVVVMFSFFWCPWEPVYYQKDHIPHGFIIKDLSPDGKLHCHDPLLFKDDEILPDDHFINGVYHIYTVRKKKPKDPPSRWPQFFEDHLFRLFQKESGQRTTFEAMLHFREFLIHSLDLELELKEGMEHSPLVLRLDDIYRARRKFAKILQYLANQTGEMVLNQFAEDFLRFGDDWLRVKLTLVKMHVVTETKRKKRPGLLKKVSDILQSAATEEQRAVKALLEQARRKQNQLSLRYQITSPLYVDELSRAPSSAKLPQTLNAPYQCLDLSLLMNHKGLFSPEDLADKQRYPASRFFYIEESSPFLQKMDIGGVLYHLRSENHPCDNIRCEEQVLSIPEGNYRTLNLLGWSDWGDTVESLELHFNDGSWKELEVYFPNWCTPDPRDCGLFAGTYPDGIQLAWKGRGNFDEIQVPEAGIFSGSYPVDSTRSLITLHLPYAPTFHLFAITLSH